MLSSLTVTRPPARDKPSLILLRRSDAHAAPHTWGRPGVGHAPQAAGALNRPRRGWGSFSFGGACPLDGRFLWTDGRTNFPLQFEFFQ